MGAPFLSLFWAREVGILLSQPDGTLYVGKALSAELWLRYRCATHGGAIFKGARLRQTGVVMASETAKQKDTMKVEKLSLLILTLCIVMLVYVLVAKPF